MVNSEISLLVRELNIFTRQGTSHFKLRQKDNSLCRRGESLEFCIPEGCGDQISRSI